MKISCTPASFSGPFERKELDLAKYLETLAAVGAEATDIMDPRFYKGCWQDPEKDLAALPGLLKANGLKISAYGTSNNFSVREPERLAQQIENVKTAIHSAAELGVSTLRIFGGYHKDLGPEHTMDYAEGLKQIVRAIEAVLPCAEKNGVTFALENHGRLPGLAEEVLYIMKYFDSPNLGVCMDIANFYASNMNETEDAISAYHLLKKYLRHVHCKETIAAPPGSPRRRQPCICGKGDGVVPLRHMAYLMQKDNFNGYWALEYEGSDGFDGAFQSLQYIKSVKDVAELLYPEVAS